MMKSIVVPLDGSKFSESSLPLATELARATGARLHLAQVHVPYEPEQLLAKVGTGSLRGLDLDTEGLRPLLAGREVGVDLLAVGEVVRQYGVDVGEFQRVERLDDRLGRCATLEGADDQFQQDAALAHTDRPADILPQRDLDRLDG